MGIVATSADYAEILDILHVHASRAPRRQHVRGIDLVRIRVGRVCDYHILLSHVHHLDLLVILGRSDFMVVQRTLVHLAIPSDRLLPIVCPRVLT